MSDTLVTVVIPVYKVEKYLDRCINSVVAQTYRNLEIILVDDGSPDRCPQMCDDWAEKDSRIRVIHKENQGLGMARNTGIEHARGAYICFFDSDDYIAPNTIELAYNLARKESADLVVFGTTEVGNSALASKVRTYNLPQWVYVGSEVQEVLLPQMVGSSPLPGSSLKLRLSAWCVLYSLSLINRANWRFVSEREIISEDVYSLLRLYAHVRKVAILPMALYFYCENGTSLSRSYRQDRYEKNKLFYLKCLELCRECAYSKDVIRLCAVPYLSFTMAFMKQVAEYHDPKTAVVKLRSIIDDELLQKVLHEKYYGKTNFKKRILFWTIRSKWYYLCYVLLVAKNTVKGKR